MPYGRYYEKPPKNPLKRAIKEQMLWEKFLEEELKRREEEKKKPPAKKSSEKEKPKAPSFNILETMALVFLFSIPMCWAQLYMLTELVKSIPLK